MTETRDGRGTRAPARTLRPEGETPPYPRLLPTPPPGGEKRPPKFSRPQISAPDGTQRRHPQARLVPLFSTRRAAKCAATARQGRGTGRKNRDRKKPRHRPEEPRSPPVRGYTRHPPPKPHHGPLMPFKRLVPSGAPPLWGVSGSLWVLRVCQPPL